MTLKKRIGILTSGGDAPGLNAFIAAATIGAELRGWETKGVRYGFKGLLGTSDIVDLNSSAVKNITQTGGTILGTSNNVDPFNAGEKHPRDKSGDIIKNIKTAGLSALLVAGGDGSLKIANRLSELGAPIIFIPKTIDNDVPESELSIGFLSAVQAATRSGEALRSTGESHSRIMILEVMGRDSGWIALYSGLATLADAILIPEIKFSFKRLVDGLKKHLEKETHSALVVVAEGIQKNLPEQASDREKYLVEELSKHLKTGVRYTVVGHLQRGTPPIAMDRIFAQQCAAKALELVEKNELNRYIAYRESGFTSLPLNTVSAHSKTIQADDFLLKTAESIGINLARP